MGEERKERRRFSRADYPCKVVVLRSDLKEPYSSHTKNLGVAGFCVVLPKVFPAFCLVEALIYLQDGTPPLECSGRIVWSERNGSAFDTGIEFVDLKDADILRIERVIGLNSKD